MNQPKFITYTSLLFTALLLFFTGCSENTLTPEKLAETEQGGTWFFAGHVIDYYGTNDSAGNAIIEVTITTINNGKEVSATTNESGFFSIGDLSPGVHTFKFEKSGYETIYNYSPSNGQNQQIGKFYNVENATINMYKNDATVSGKAYLLGENETRTPANGARIRVDVGSSYRPRFRYATSGTDGSFSLSNLPRVNVNLQVEHQDFSGATYGYVNSGGSELSKNVDLVKKSDAGVIDLRRVFASVIQSLTNNFVGQKVVGDTITVGFDVGLDVASVSVSLSGTEVSYTFSNDDKNLTVVPVEKLFAGSNLSFNVSGMTKDGKAFSWNKTLSTHPEPMVISTNTLDADGQPVEDFNPTDTIKLTLDQKIAKANPWSSLRGKVDVMVDSNKISIAPIVPISNSTRNTLVGSLEIETDMGNIATIDIPNFSLLPSIFLVSSNVLDRNLSGLRDIDPNTTVTVMLSDSVASVVKTNSSYPDYEMTLDSTGKMVTVKRNSIYNIGSSYSFVIYGTMVGGQTFSVSHTTFYIVEEQTLRLKSSNVLDTNLNGLNDVSKDVQVMVVLSDSVQSVVKNHPSYTDWEMTLSADGRTVTVKKLNGYNSGSGYSFVIYGVKANGVNFSVSHTTFRIKDYPNIRIISGTALDSNLSGRQDVDHESPVMVTLSDSVKSVIKTHASYTDYEMQLDSTGRGVTITRLNGGFLPGGSYSFVIYGTNQSGENFSVSHTTFRMADVPNVRIAASSHLDTNFSGKQDVPLSMDTITVMLTDSVQSIIGNHSSYPDWDLTLQSDGKTIKVTRRTPMVSATSYNFVIYGVNRQGENFTVSHGTWRMTSIPNFGLKWTNLKDSVGLETFEQPLRHVIKYVFSRKVDTSKVFTVSWSNYSGQYKIGLSANGDTLTITALQAFNEKTRVGIYIASVRSTDGATNSPGWLYFNTVNNSTPPKKVSDFWLDTTGAYSTNIPKDGGLGGGMPLKWTEQDSVTNYLIYAKGKNDGNTEWKQVASVASGFAGGALFGTHTLTNANLADFSRVTSRPLSMGDEIILVIAATNAEGQGAVSTDTIKLQDVVHVGQEIVSGSYVNQLTSVAYSGASWNNAGASSVETYINITFPEWMDTSVDPTITYTEAGGDGAAVASAGASKWVWLTKTTGRFEITVPATTNWSGDNVTINVVGMKDNSGNTSASNNYTTDAGGLAVTP